MAGILRYPVNTLTRTGAATMPNLDLKKQYKALYNPSAKAVSVVTVPPFPYLMIDGKGNPNTSQQYTEAVTALYAMAYGVRALSKADDLPFTVPPMGGLWCFEGQPPDSPFDMTTGDKDRFLWTMLIQMPEHITGEMVETAREVVRKKKKNPLGLDDLRFEVYDEGEAVQILHIGSYDDEAPTIAKLHDHITANGWKFSKPHHEIYLSDPRKVAPDKLKTVIRQPFTRGA
jgi:hypothetical protein